MQKNRIKIKTLIFNKTNINSSQKYLIPAHFFFKFQTTFFLIPAEKMLKICFFLSKKKDKDIKTLIFNKEN